MLKNAVLKSMETALFRYKDQFDVAVYGKNNVHAKNCTIPIITLCGQNSELGFKELISVIFYLSWGFVF
jgi:hypothetical protein